jgi:hypothetical protein
MEGYLSSMNLNEVQAIDGYKLIQPTKSKEQIGISTRAFYDNQEKYQWEKTDGARGAVYYKVPLSFIELHSKGYSTSQEKASFNSFKEEDTDSTSNGFIEAEYTVQQPSELVNFMRETMSKFESLSGVITDLKVENSQYKLITDGKEREIDTIKNELFEAKQQNETIRQQLEGKAKEYETLMNYNEALLKQVESLQLSLEEEKRKGPIDKLFRR